MPYLLKESDLFTKLRRNVLMSDVISSRLGYVPSILLFLKEIVGNPGDGPVNRVGMPATFTTSLALAEFQDFKNVRQLVKSKVPSMFGFPSKYLYIQRFTIFPGHAVPP